MGTESGNLQCYWLRTQQSFWSFTSLLWKSKMKILCLFVWPVAYFTLWSLSTRLGRCFLPGGFSSSKIIIPFITPDGSFLTKYCLCSAQLLSWVLGNGCLEFLQPFLNSPLFSKAEEIMLLHQCEPLMVSATYNTQNYLAAHKELGFLCISTYPASVLQIHQLGVPRIKGQSNSACSSTTHLLTPKLC